MRRAKILKVIRKNTKNIKSQNRSIKNTRRSQRRSTKNRKIKNLNIKKTIINLRMKIQKFKKSLNLVNWLLLHRRKSPSGPRVKVLLKIID